MCVHWDNLTQKNLSGFPQKNTFLSQISNHRFKNGIVEKRILVISENNICSNTDVSNASE